MSSKFLKLTQLEKDFNFYSYYHSNIYNKLVHIVCIPAITWSLFVILNNVRFLPRQPPKAMGQFYAIVDAVLVHLIDDPLFRITIPSKIQTYLYMGKPIVIAMEGDAVDLVEQPGAGLICKPMDPVALAETVSNLVAMPAAELVRVGQAGAKFYEENLSMKVENGDLLVVRSNKEDENDKVLYRLQLTKDIDYKNIQAKSQDGVLHLTLPALTEKKSKCINIE